MKILLFNNIYTNYNIIHNMITLYLNDVNDGYKFKNMIIINSLLNDKPYITYKINTSIVIEYYPDFYMFKLVDKNNIFYIFNNNDNLDNFNKSIQMIINNMTNKYDNDIITLKNDMSDDIVYEDGSTCMNENRIYFLNQKINDLKKTWNNPYTIIPSTYVDKIFNIDIKYHISNLKNRFNISDI